MEIVNIRNGLISRRIVEKLCLGDTGISTQKDMMHSTAYAMNFGQSS